jgi:hypothetical protein
MEPVEIKILQYTFHFRQLSWREEAAIKFAKGADRARVVLANALVDVSGLPVNTVAEADKVLKPLPATIIQRMIILWRGSYPVPRRFGTTGLYRAPGTGVVAARLKQVEEQREEIMDKVELEMREKFGDREINEALEAERTMLRNSKMRGATRATPDAAAFGATPPIDKGKK